MILAAAIQESNLTMQSGGGGAVQGYFQQDASYPGRADPDTNITGFYDRLDEKRRSGGWSKDMWANVFWLQQRPGDAVEGWAVGRDRQQLGW